MPVTVQEVVEELLKMGLTGVEFCYDSVQESTYYDLNTKAKSELRVYSDFHVEGRYGYKGQLDYSAGINDIIEELFYEFKRCLYGRDYFNSEWMEIGVKLGLIEKKVTNHTTVEYI